jgi:hypothetical protein
MMKKEKREEEEDGRVRRRKQELARDRCRRESPHGRITWHALKKLASTNPILFSEALERFV